MIKKFHLSNSSFQQAGSRITTASPRSFWWRVCMVLVLVLTLVNSGQPALAQAAADDPADIAFEVGASPQASPPLCINQPLKIYVSLSKVIHKTLNAKEFVIPRGFITGVKIRGSVSTNIGILKPTDMIIGEELSALAPGAADFLFIGKKPGKATITFTSDVPGVWTGSALALALGSTVTAKKAEVQVTVRNCKFKAETISTWSAGMTIVATIDDAIITADDQGNFTSAATVNWMASVIGSVGCGAESVIAPSQAEFTGRLDEGDQLLGNVTFQPMSASGIANCGPAGVSTDNFGIPDPLTINFASTGGASRQPQAFKAKNGSFTGSSIIIITPETDEAVSFNPGNQIGFAGTPLIGGITAWHSLPGLFHSLLAVIQ